VRVSYLPEPHKHPLWPHIEQALVEATEAGVEPFNPAFDFLWAAFEDGVFWGFATARLNTDGAELLCVSGKRFREWIGPMEAAICEWARRNGAKRLVSEGRRGWARFASAYGWGVADLKEQQTYEKILIG
jgi:hypothetical protein